MGFELVTYCSVTSLAASNNRDDFTVFVVRNVLPTWAGSPRGSKGVGQSLLQAIHMGAVGFICSQLLV